MSATGNGVFCAICGSTPARKATFWAHKGMIVVMSSRRRDGPFCRDCGIAVFRDMQGDTLWQGWWGLLSLLGTPITLLLNLPARWRISRLGAPIPGAPGTPLPTGRPLALRPQILGLLIPLTVVLAAWANPPTHRHDSPGVPAARPSVAGVPSAPASSAPTVAARESFEVGGCVWNRKGGSLAAAPELVAVPCEDPRAQARILDRFPYDGGGGSTCRLHPGNDVVYTEARTATASGLTLCLDLLR